MFALVVHQELYVVVGYTKDVGFWEHIVNVAHYLAHTLIAPRVHGRLPRRGIKADYGRPHQFLLSKFLINKNWCGR